MDYRTSTSVERPRSSAKVLSYPTCRKVNRCLIWIMWTGARLRRKSCRGWSSARLVVPRGCFHLPESERNLNHHRYHLSKSPRAKHSTIIQPTRTERSFPTLTKARAQMFRCSSYHSHAITSISMTTDRVHVCLTAPPDDEIHSSFRCHGIISGLHIQSADVGYRKYLLHFKTHHKRYTSCSATWSFERNRASLRCPFANAIENGV